MRNGGAGVWAGSHTCGKGRWEKTSPSHAVRRGWGLPTARGEVPAGRGWSHAPVQGDGLGAGTGWGNGPGGQKEAKKRGFESPGSFCGVGNGSAEVSPLLSSLLLGLATAVTSQQTPPHAVPHSVPPGGGWHRQAVVPTSLPSLGAAGKRERRARSPESSEGGVAGSSLPASMCIRQVSVVYLPKILSHCKCHP